MGSWVAFLIIGGLIFVFAFFGVFSPDPSMTGTSIGSVGGDPISLREFSQQYNQRVQALQGFGIKPEQIKAFRIEESVFDGLVDRKLMLNNAKHRKLLLADEVLREEIRKIPAFQTDGHFDRLKYKNVLEANRYTSVAFESLVREDLQVRKWQERFNEWAQVSDLEVQNTYILEQNKRTLDYVWLPYQAFQKKISVSKAEVSDFLKNDAKLKLAQNRFESRKTLSYEGKKFEDVKEEIARDLIASSQLEGTKSIALKAADRVEALMSQKKVNKKEIERLLKDVNIKMQTAKDLSLKGAQIPGVYPADAIIQEVFSSETAMDRNAKKFELPAGVFVGKITDKKSAQLSDLDEKKSQQIVQKIKTEKQRRLMDSYLDFLKAQTEIKKNQDLLSNYGQ